jgi:hypothetical protein
LSRGHAPNVHSHLPPCAAGKDHLQEIILVPGDDYVDGTGYLETTLASGITHQDEQFAQAGNQPLENIIAAHSLSPNSKR